MYSSPWSVRTTSLFVFLLQGVFTGCIGCSRFWLFSVSGLPMLVSSMICFECMCIRPMGALVFVGVLLFLFSVHRHLVPVWVSCMFFIVLCWVFITGIRVRCLVFVWWQLQ